MKWIWFAQKASNYSFILYGCQDCFQTFLKQANKSSSKTNSTLPESVYVYIYIVNVIQHHYSCVCAFRMTVWHLSLYLLLRFCCWYSSWSLVAISFCPVYLIIISVIFFPKYFLPSLLDGTPTTLNFKNWNCNKYTCASRSLVWWEWLFCKDTFIFNIDNLSTVVSFF